MFMTPPARFAAAEAAPALSGLLAHTLVETESGWRPAASLKRGDRLPSFDGGLRRIVALGRDWLMPGPQRLVHLPGGILGVTDDTQLLATQPVLVDTWDSLPDAVVALVPALAAQVLGATLRPLSAPVELVTPVFEEEEVIFASGGLPLYCPGIATGTAQVDSFFPRLALDQARDLLSARRSAIV